MRIVKRSQALKEGLSTYYTGVPCAYGHRDYRYVTTGGCKECGRERAREYRSKFSASRSLKMRGFVSLVVWVHPDDVAGMKEHAQALIQVRDMMEPAETRGLPPGYRWADGKQERESIRAQPTQEIEVESQPYPDIDTSYERMKETVRRAHGEEA